MSNVHKIILLICLSLFASVNFEAKGKPSPYVDPREEKAIKALNAQILLNEELKRIGREDETNYILDLRGSWWQGEKDRVSAETIDKANRHLRDINKATGVSFYTMLSAPVVSDKVIFKNVDGGYIVLYQGKVESLPKEGSEEWEGKREYYEGRLQFFREIDSQYFDEYTKNVAERSRLSNETSKGLLLNVEGIINAIDENGNSGILYIPFVALGKRLSLGTIEAVKSKLTANLDDGDNFADNFQNALLYHIDVLGYNVEKLIEDGEGFDTEDENGINVEAKILKYKGGPPDPNSYRLELYNVEPPNHVSEQHFGNVTLVDYAQITKVDNQFVSTFQTQLQDSDEGVSLSNLLEGEEIKLYIITTSDQLLSDQQSAIQLASEKAEALQGEGNNIVIGMHFILNDTELKVQVASFFDPEMRDLVRNRRMENGYNWYVEKSTGKLIQAKDPGELKTDQYGYTYIESEYSFLARYAHEKPFLNDDYFFNNVSDWYGGAMLFGSAEFAEEWLRAHDKQVSQIVLDVAFTAATGGIYAGTKLVIQAGAKVTFGAAIDVASQIAMMQLFEDKSFEDAFANVEYGTALWGGVEGLIGDWKTVAALNCFRTFTVEAYASEKEGKELIISLVSDCGTQIVLEYLQDKISPKIKVVLRRAVKNNYGKFITNLKKVFPALDEQKLILILKQLDAVEEINTNTFKTKDLKHIKTAAWKTDVTTNGKSAKAFWDDASAECNHFIDGDIYVKHNPTTGEYLVGNTKSGDILEFNERTDLTTQDYSDLSKRLNSLAGSFKSGFTKADLIKEFKDCFDASGKRIAGKKVRPPSDYLTDAHIKQHLDKFKEGASFIFLPTDIANPNHKSFNPEKYVMLKSDMRKIVEEFKRTGDTDYLEDALGYKRGSLRGKESDIHVMDIDSPKVKMPSGNEGGANEFWQPGGYNSGGLHEACLDGQIIVHNNDMSSLKDAKSIFDY